MYILFLLVGIYSLNASKELESLTFSEGCGTSLANMTLDAPSYHCIMATQDFKKLIKQSLSFSKVIEHQINRIEKNDINIKVSKDLIKQYDDQINQQEIFINQRTKDIIVANNHLILLKENIIDLYQPFIKFYSSDDRVKKFISKIHMMETWIETEEVKIKNLQIYLSSDLFREVIENQMLILESQDKIIEWQKTINSLKNIINNINKDDDSNSWNFHILLLILYLFVLLIIFV